MAKTQPAPRRGASVNGRQTLRARIAPAQRKRFLEHLAKGWTVHASCDAAGIVRQSLYKVRGRDEAFADEWDNAIEAGVQALEQEAIRRGAFGVERPVYQGGELVGHVTEYSDNLLTFMLRAKRPHLYRERHEHKHEHRGTVALQLDRLSDSELELLEQLVGKATS